MEGKMSERKESFLSMLIGVLWGCAGILANTFTHVFSFEQSLVHHLITFISAGVLFALLVSGLFQLTGDWIPLKRPFSKAVLIAVSLWSGLYLGGVVLSQVFPYRYHLVLGQSAQGLILAILLGVMMGFLLEKSRNKVVA